MFYPNRAVFSFSAPVPFSPVLGLPLRRSQHGYKFWFGMVEIWYRQVVYPANFIRAEPSFWDPCHFPPQPCQKIFCNVNRALVLFAIPDVKITGLNIIYLKIIYRINSNFYKLSFHVTATEPSPMAKGLSVVSFF